MVAAKIRIYELSKALGVSNKDIITALEKHFGMEIKSHSSSIDQSVADQVTQIIKGKPVESSKAPPSVIKAADIKAAAAPAQKEPVKEAPKATPAQPVTTPSPAPQPVAPPKLQPVAQPAAQKKIPPKEAHPVTPAVATTVHPPAAATAVKEKLPEIKPSEVKEAAIKPITPPSPPQVTPKTKPVSEKEPEPEIKTVKINEPLTVVELAQRLKLKETEIIKHLFMKGMMVTVTQTLDVAFSQSVAKEFGFELEEAEHPALEKGEYQSAALERKEALDKSKYRNLQSRSPVISIMGHVDHGKTSLLDAIRETRHKIVDTEAGGITQSIGAYTVEKDGHKIVFLDTPGHEAFTSMRMRGAKSTDVAILVVAADDGVMPQTIEAISHAKAAKIPIIVAVNKIDKEGADPDRVLVQLSEHGLVAEKWGGDTVTVEVSALQKLGIDDLLEMIVLVSDLLELKADPTVPAEGVIIEAQLDKRMGPVATALIQNGMMRVGDNILMGPVGGRVRALISDSGERIHKAGPSTPVEIIGLNEVPQAGDYFHVVRDEKKFKQLLQEEKNKARDQRISARGGASLVTITRTESEDGSPIEQQSLNVIIKADTQGSSEAVLGAIAQLSTDEVKVNIIHAGTGNVSEADIMLASASNAVIIAFNVREEGNAIKLMEQNEVRLLKFDVIYHIVEEIEKIMLGKLSPDTQEIESGQAEVRQLFTVGKTAVIAGCMVTKGKIVRNAKAVVTRGSKELFTGTIDNLKRFKDDAKEVASGYECGISFNKFNALEIGDIITVYTIEETERTSL